MDYKEHYKPNEMKGFPRHYKCLRSAVLASIDEHSAFYVAADNEVHTFLAGQLLIIEIHDHETPTHKLKKYI